MGFLIKYVSWDQFQLRWQKQQRQELRQLNITFSHLIG